MAAQRILLSRDQLGSAGSSAGDRADRADRHPDDGDPPGGHVALDLSSVRLLRVPDVAPPFDGEVLPSAARPAPGTGAPTTIIGVVPAAVSGPAHAALASHGQGAVGNVQSPGGADPERVPGGDEWTQQFARLLVETLAGVRPSRQILPWLTGRARVHLRRVAPVFGGGQRPRVVRVLASQPTGGVVEMSVIVSLGSRMRALAVRLEEAARFGQPARCPVRWLCTDIESA